MVKNGGRLKSNPVFLPHETFKNPNSDCVGVESKGRGAGPVLAHPPTTPIPLYGPGWRRVNVWSVGAVLGHPPR